MAATLLRTSVLALVCGSVCAASIESRLKPTRPGQMNSAVGGACYACLSQTYCQRANVPCTKRGAVWYYQVFKGIEQKFCLDMQTFGKQGTDGSGTTGCNADTFQDCVYTYSCSDAACKNCGDPAIEQKTTRCVFSGDPCKVGS
jgi:hypothetical protein